MKIRNKLMLSALSIIIFLMTLSVTATSVIIYRQNKKNANDVLKQAANVVRENISILADKLLRDTRQMATINNMGSKIKYLSDQKADGDFEFTKSSYIEVIESVYNIGFSSEVWRITIYDKEGDLTAFFLKNKDTVTIGYPQLGAVPILHVASLKIGAKVDSNLWRKTDLVPGIAVQNKDKVTANQKVQFRLINNNVCLVSQVWATGLEYNEETDAMENVTVGIVTCVRKLDQSFVESTSRLTGTNINIYGKKSFSVGNLSEYKNINLDEIQIQNKAWDFENQEIQLGDINLTKDSYFQAVLPIYHNDAYIGAIVSLHSKAAQIENTWQVIKLLCLIAFGCILLVVPIVFVFSNKYLIKPITGMETVFSALAKGNLTVRSEVKSKDELGRLSASANTFIENLQGLIGQLLNDVLNINQSSSQLKLISEDMYSKAGQMDQQSMDTTVVTDKTAINIKNMAAAAEQVSAEVKSVLTSSSSVSQNMNAIGGEVKNVSKSVGGVAAAIEEMYASLNDVAKNSAKGANVTGDATEKANITSEIVNHLNDAAKEISNVVDMIKRIAAQTNLLALNAAIEAAGAGDAGKGFAVVANEVKELAKQTAGATEDIREKIEGMQSNTDSAISAITAIASVINEINEIMATIAAAVEEQTATTNEISKNINGTSAAAEHVSKTVQDIVKLETEVNKSIEEVAEAAVAIANDATEASKHTDIVSDNISEVNNVAKATSHGAEKIKIQAEALKQLGVKLQESAEQFQL